MNQKFRDMLRECPYDLSRLENLTGDLEHVTGRELVGMFSLGNNNSPYKELWSFEKRKDVVLQKKIVGSADDCTSYNSSLTSSEDFIQQDLTRAASPFTDPSPSPPPYATHQPFLPNSTTLRYYRLTFAGKKTIWAVGYFHPEPTSKKICSYGGSKEGERCFLSSREYGTVSKRC
jgi:hypothetical protein